MKQEEKEHLLNDKNLSAEEQAEVKLLFNRLDALGIEYQTLSTSLREIMKDDKDEIDQFIKECTDYSDNGNAEAKHEIEDVLDSRVEFDVYIHTPTLDWIFNITPGQLDDSSYGKSIDVVNLRTSFTAFEKEYKHVNLYGIREYIFDEYLSNYVYPQRNSQLFLWSNSLKKFYDGHCSLNTTSAVDFYAALSPTRITELKEARFRKFLSENPIWEESYAAYGRERIVHKTENAFSNALNQARKEATQYVKYMNPQFDFDDILDQITE
jgi:hypothetical protein